MCVLRDVLTPGLCIVFCGTAVGSASARRQAYYAGPDPVDFKISSADVNCETTRMVR